jgi:gamma-butyrobetaine dioxygenase
MESVCCRAGTVHSLRSFARVGICFTKSESTYYKPRHRGFADISEGPSDGSSLKIKRYLVNETGPKTKTFKGASTMRVNAMRTYGKRIEDSKVELGKIGWQAFHPAFLRDACTCAQCVDSSSKQKNFQTTDIPADITPSSIETLGNGDIQIKWAKDLPGFGHEHISNYPSQFFRIHSSRSEILKDRFESGAPRTWGRNRISKKLQFVSYEDYMTTDEALYRALYQLHYLGLLVIRGVPTSETAVEDITRRIGTLRDTFYGRTWDVKSVPQAKNVAYTAQYLGLHMDLLYMANPPGFQFLHCLKNTCEGGSSLFSDSFHAANKLTLSSFVKLANSRFAYHYRNAGEHYYHLHPVIEAQGDLTDMRRRILNVNYSPPFQANHFSVAGDKEQSQFASLLEASREFASLVESPENLYEYRLQEGECVIFNNRRVLHGRRQFDTSVGERWLKGAYIDTDVFMSRYRVLKEKFQNVNLVELNADATFVSGQRPEAPSEAEIERKRYRGFFGSLNSDVSEQETKTPESLREV